MKEIEVEPIDFQFYDNVPIYLKQTGGIFEIKYLYYKNDNCPIYKMNKYEYYITSTGEVKKFKRKDKRIDDLVFLKKSMSNLKDLINNNVLVLEYSKFITLTYRENMTDTKRLYKDFDKFIKKLKYHYSNDIEYISVCEPQGRGAWHIHCILIFISSAPYIPKNELAEMWGQGFVDIEKMDGVDDLGTYLSSYLTNLDITTDLKHLEDNKLTRNDIVSKEMRNTEKTPKKMLKGGRLHFYPSGFRFYRCSRNIKKPKIEKMTYKEAKEKIGLDQPTYSKAYMIKAKKFKNLVAREYYNINRKK